MEELNTERFDEKIYDDEESALVLFHRNGCHVCEELEHYLNTIVPTFSGVSFYAVTAENEIELFERFGLMGVPQTLFFANGALVKSLSGRKPNEEYTAALSELQNA